MSKKVEQIVSVTCDVCGKPCGDHQRFEYTYGHFMGHPKKVIVTLRAIDYGVTDGDVCTACAKDVLKEIVRHIL